MNTNAMCLELAASMPRILDGDDPINWQPEAFYPARVQRFEALLASGAASKTTEGTAE